MKKDVEKIKQDNLHKNRNSMLETVRKINKTI